MTVRDFVPKKVIGKGSYGTVCLVQKKDTGGVYAMKAVRKSNSSRTILERDILVSMGKSSPWVAKIFFTFQDSENSYFVMEYLLGGEFLGLLVAHNTLSEDATRFYMAELLSAIESLHKLDYIHR